MTEYADPSAQEKEEIRTILDTIDGGGRVCVRRGKPRQLKAAVNMCTAMASGAVPDLMEIEPARFLE